MVLFLADAFRLYDLAGNMTGDDTYTYGYNAESEIKSAAGVNYTYDGDGNRLEKSSGKIYWYGAGTEILDESDLSGNFTNEYVFFGGRRIALRTVSTGTIYYYEEDMLGSSRTMVQAGQTSVCFDADFLPFGYEKDVTTTCTQNYKFEGKERDTETNNDDFGARYYTFRLGRWLSADWSSVPAPVPYANLANPQTLNLYAMVSDNPESFADLDGHQCVVGSDCVNGNSSPGTSNSGSNVNPDNNPNNNTTVQACATDSSAPGCASDTTAGSRNNSTQENDNRQAQGTANNQTTTEQQKKDDEQYHQQLDQRKQDFLKQQAAPARGSPEYVAQVSGKVTAEMHAGKQIIAGVAAVEAVGVTAAIVAPAAVTAAKAGLTAAANPSNIAQFGEGFAAGASPGASSPPPSAAGTVGYVVGQVVSKLLGR